jgi:hypothetical protein
MLYKNPFHGFSHTWHILMGIPVPHSLGGRTMKIVLFGFHVNRVRSVIQRMPDMLAHMEKGEIMARPKKEKELARSHLIAFRLTDVEYDLVTRMAKEAGLSASAYIRKLLLDGKVNITYEVVADVPELQKLAAEFGKIGSNLNQIARYFHMGGIRSKAMQDEIHECISQIFDMRKEVAEMAGDYHGSVKTYCKQER